MSFQNAKKVIGNYSYLISDKIGDGCSSQVYRGIDDKTKQPVSIKVVPKSTHQRTEMVEMAEAEINALQLFRESENVLNLKHVVQTRNSIYIITQLCSKGTLNEVLSHERKFSEGKAINILQQIIKGYKSIHSHNLIHRDIKPANIFIGAGDVVKIGDFGFAIDAGQCLQPCSENIGSPLYMAYESLVGNIYSFKSDIWAIGVTFFEMLMGKTPWKSKKQKELADQLQTFKVDNVITNKISESSYNFLKRVLVNSVEDRMGPEELFSYSFTNSSIHVAKQDHGQHLIEKKPEISRKMTVSFAQALANKPPSQKLNAVEKHENMRGSQPSTEQHSKSKQRLTCLKENSKYLMQPKSKIASSVLVPSPRVKEGADKKMGGSLIGIQQKSTKEKLTIMENQQREKQLTKEKAKLNSTLKEKAENHDQKLTSKIEKEILYEIQSQINYFRFLFKLGKRLSETLKTNDESIKSLKQHLFYLTYKKIEQITLLQHLSFHEGLVSAFKKTTEYKNMLEVLKQYKDRYQKEEDRLSIHPNLSQQDLASLIKYCLKVLYQNIVKIEEDSENLNRKKGLLFIAEDLLHLKQLFGLQCEGNWQTFHQKSDISKILDKVQSQDSLKQQWMNLKKQIRLSLTL